MLGMLLSVKTSNLVWFIASLCHIAYTYMASQPFLYAWCLPCHLHGRSITYVECLESCLAKLGEKNNVQQYLLCQELLRGT